MTRMAIVTAIAAVTMNGIKFAYPTVQVASGTVNIGDEAVAVTVDRKSVV